MNNILVINNKVKYLDNYNVDNDFICVRDNVITFKKDASYNIYYKDTLDIDINIIALDNVCVKLFIYMCEDKVNSNIVYKLNDNAIVNVSKFYSSDVVRENIIFNLEGYMSKVNYNFSNICKKDFKYDFVINHNNSSSISNIYNKTICLDNASCNYKIDSIVINGNKNCLLNQDTKIVNLGNNNSSIMPNMFISEDMVDARHASIIGNINQEELFYLLIRGISYDEAMKLLIKGFILSNLDVDMEKRSMILEVINNNWR